MDTSRLRAQLEHFVADPGRELGAWARFLHFQIKLWRYCVRRLYAHDVLMMSAALCFRTIFTLIPVLVLGLLLLKTLGAIEESKRGLRTLLEGAGFAQIAVVQDGQEAVSPVPDTAPATQPLKVINVADKIEELVASVERQLNFTRIGPVGALLLIWSAVGLLTAMEQSLNRIFGAARSRAVFRRLLLYWSALTLGPLVITAAMYLGRRAIDTFASAPVLSWLLVGIGWTGPIIVGVLVLAALYKLLPNTRVRYQSALGGAAVAGLLWLVAKWGFALYVRHFVLTGNLYGVLGVLPLFLLWVYYSWLIFLFGGELAYTAVHLNEMVLAETAERMVLGPSDLLASAVAVAGHFLAGRGPIPARTVGVRLGLPEIAAQRLLDRLCAAGLVCPVEDPGPPGYVPGRPVTQIAVADVLELADSDRQHGERDGCDPSIRTAVNAIRGRTRSALAGLTLADLRVQQPSGG